MPKLLCVIIDGLRAESLACAHVPCIDALAGRGALIPNLQPPPPGLTLPTLISLLTSLAPIEHGILTNSAATPIAPQAVSLFSLLRYRNQTGAAFYSSDRLRPLFPPGTLQTGLLINSQSIRNVDRDLAQQASLHLQREQPDFCLLYLEGADIAAVHFGSGSEPHLDSVEQADQALAVLLEHLAEVGLHRDYTIMVMGCGGSLQAEPESSPSLPLLFSGPGVRKGQRLEHPPMLVDLAPTMAAMLGLAPHPDWRGRVLAEVLHPTVLNLRSTGRGKVRRPPARGSRCQPIPLTETIAS